MAKGRNSYKEPVFLFTSSSMRQAAWAGWYSALGNRKLAQQHVHAAHSEWLKELGAGRRYEFLGRYNNDVWRYVSEKRLKEIIDEFFKCVKAEIIKSKALTRRANFKVKIND